MTGAKKKTYGVVIGLGLCALLADQLLTSGAPASATGAVTDDAHADSPSPSSGPLTDEVSKLPVLAVTKFPDNLALLADTTRRRDPFTMSAPVWEVLSPVDSDPQEAYAARNLGPSAAEAFLQRRRLSAVMRVGLSRTAVLDGLIMTEGQDLDGCTLIHIAAREVHFDCSGEEITLTLHNPLSTASGK